MELQTGDHPGWDRPPVAFTKTSVVSQFATFTTTRDQACQYMQMNVCVLCTCTSRYMYINYDPSKLQKLAELSSGGIVLSRWFCWWNSRPHVS